MVGVKKDDAREHRIDMEVIVDAYDEQERAMHVAVGGVAPEQAITRGS